MIINDIGTSPASSALQSNLSTDARVGYWSYDPSNGNESWSEDTYHIIGDPPEAPFRSLFARFRPINAKMRYALSERDNSFEGTFVHTRSDGQRIRIAYQADVEWLPDKKDHPRIVRGVLQDVTRYFPIASFPQPAPTQLRKEEDFSHLFYSLLDSLQDGIFITDVNFIIQRVNKAMETMYPYCLPMVGRPCYKVFNVETICPNCPAERMFISGKKEIMIHPETCYEGKEPDWLEHSSHPFIDPATGEIVGSINMIRNITDQVKNEEKVKEYSKQLEEMVVELTVAKQKADQASEAKSFFLANMSHEIRTPMSVILGYNEFLADPATDNEQRQDALRIIRSNADLLLQILNDVLDISKMEAGKMNVEIRQVPLIPILDEIVVLFARKAKEKHISLVIENSTPFPELIQTDSIRLTQILMNIISNAVKFTSNGGVYITIFMSQNENDKAIPNTLVIEIRDTGIGMSQETLSQLFQPFQQGDVSTTRHYGGTGLGLAIVNRLADLLGGRIETESVLDVGTTFRLLFPQPIIPENRMLDSIEEGRIISKSSMSLPACGNPRPFEGRRILLVEDGKDIQRLFELILTQAGADVCPVDNGVQALEIAQKENEAGTPYDLIVMDMHMPLMDGYTCTRKLRESGYTNPIVALSATVEQKEIDRCLVVGCNDYAIKPIDKEQILQFVQKNLAKPEKSR